MSSELLVPLLPARRLAKSTHRETATPHGRFLTSRPTAFQNRCFSDCEAAFSHGPSKNCGGDHYYGSSSHNPSCARFSKRLERGTFP